MKRIVALVAVLLLLTGCTIDPGYLEVVDPAPNTTVSTTGNDSTAVCAPFTISLGTVMGKTGATVSVPLTVSAGAYLTNADLVITYDPAALRPVLGADENLGPAVKADWRAGLWCGEQEAGILRLMLASEADGGAEAMTVCTLSFEVLGSSDVTLSLTATAIGVCPPSGELTDAVGEKLVTTGTGTVAVLPAE